MAELLDVRAVLSLVRRRLRSVAVVALLGGLLGVALVTWHPPLYTSTSKVLLPERPVQANGQRATWDASTQVSIAESDAVLGAAAKAVSPPLSRSEIRSRVQVSAPSADVLSISARGSSSDAATALAEAVANAEVAYQAEATSSLSAAELSALRDRRDALQRTQDAVDDQIVATQERLADENPQSTIGRRDASALTQLTTQQTDLVLQINELETKMGKSSGAAGARVIERATFAERPQLLLWYVLAALGMALLAGTVAIVVMVNVTRRDAKLGARDEIADAVGSEVIASLRSQVPRSVAAWRSLLGTYSPSVAEGWNARLALAGLGLENLAMGRSETDGGETPTARHTLCVVSLQDDVRGLSMGPQIASYAASIGISTRLVPEQGDSTAALWAACSSPASDEQVRSHLRVASRRRTKHPAELTVIVAVLDRRAPRMPRLERTATVVLAVSARAASSEDLARTAVAAYESGFRISGVLVADPDPFDKTTGRLQPHERTQQHPLPSRVSGPRPVSLRDSSWTGGAS
jgi:capsular polysaccharide biosynthesis protein